jgi:hypothetical protein
VVNLGTRTNQADGEAQRTSRLRQWAGLAGLLFALAWGTSGCANFWDDVTSKDFDVKNLFVTPNPLEVLDKTADGNKRAAALRELREPNQFGGKPQEQELCVKILTTAAVSDRQALCRLAAIKTLGNYKDPRAVEALKEAYFNTKSYSAETNTIIKEQALAALGKTRSPVAREMLVLVVREPPPAKEASDMEKQQQMDLRLTAIRALSHFSHYEVTETLVKILKEEKDVALRDRAHESLQVVTGKKLPADAKEWDDYLHKQDQREDTLAQGPGRMWSWLGWR